MAKKPTAAANLMDQFADIASKTVEASDSTIARISRLADELNVANLKIAEAEDALKAAKEFAKKISENDLPEAMREAGMAKFETTNGLIVETKDELTATISVANRPRAYAWLREHGYSGLIKSELGLSFDREHAEEADELAGELSERGFDVAVSESVHPQTLKAFCKERMADTESTVEFPKDLFGVYPYTVAKVKAKK